MMVAVASSVIGAGSRLLARAWMMGCMVIGFGATGAVKCRWK